MTDTNPQPMLDPRRNAYRADLASESLRGRVNAKRFSAGTRQQVVRPSVPLRRHPSAVTSFDTEVLFGEIVTVFDVAEGWAWGQLERDRYVGYLPADALSPDVTVATHRVRALGTFLYPASDMKSPPLMHLSIGAQLAVTGSDNAFCRIASGGFVVARHVTEITRHARDFVAIAEQFVGTPYLWGGRTRVGLDCSGLVQLSLAAAGIDGPRDTDMQVAEIGIEIPLQENHDGLQRGDLVFWRGHVGIMIDGVMLLHANAYHMSTVIEPLPEAAVRIAKSGSQIVAVRRLQGVAAESR